MNPTKFKYSHALQVWRLEHVRGVSLREVTNLCVKELKNDDTPLNFTGLWKDNTGRLGKKKFFTTQGRQAQFMVRFVIFSFFSFSLSLFFFPSLFLFAKWGTEDTFNMLSSFLIFNQKWVFDATSELLSSLWTLSQFYFPV